MARLARVILPSYPHHIIQRGILVRKSTQQSDRDQVRNQNKKFRQKLRPVIIDALSDFIEQEKGGSNKTKKKKNNLFLRIKNLIKRVLQRLSN